MEPPCRTLKPLQRCGGQSKPRGTPAAPRLSQPQRRQPSLCTALRSAFYQPRRNSAFQQEVALACAEGWRPSRPISRGGQAPTLEASFQVPRSQPPAKLDISKTPWDLERFTYHREIQQLREQRMLDKPSESDLRTEPSTLAQAPQEALMPPQAETARDEEAEMVEAAALAREANQELSEDSDIESAHEQDEVSLTEDKPDSEVWFVQNGPWGKVHWPSQTPKSLKPHVGPSSAS